MRRVRPKTLCVVLNIFCLAHPFLSKMSVEQASINSNSMLVLSFFEIPLLDSLNICLGILILLNENVNFIFMVYIYSPDGKQWYSL